METKNYKLHLTDDSSENFKDWREMMNGTEDSNMVKIDAALGQKANSSIPVYGVLSAASWEGASAPYTQVLSVPGLGADQNGHIAVANNATTQEVTAATEAILVISNQSAGTLTITAKGVKPECDIPVVVILLG